VARAPAPPPAAPGRRRLTVAALVLVLPTAGLAVVSRTTNDASSELRRSPARAGVVEVRAAARPLLEVPVARLTPPGPLEERRLRALLRRTLPPTLTLVRKRARITYRYDAEVTATRVVAAARDGSTVQAARVPVASVIRAPVVRQAQRNTCESAALEVLLATTGRGVDQRRLQAALPRSGPLDPRGSGPDRVWGDPDRGYVGRPDGGGVAGGFGVYQGPVRATAARFGVRLHALAGRSPQDVYDSLLAGHAVMAWVGLSQGPFGTWRSPQGRNLKVNFGEHTVVLHGLRRDGRLMVSNPLQGTRELWTRESFETMWQLLGRRALTT
jgi:uncharacterized protein YvpB